MLDEASRSISEPYAKTASFLLDEVEEKLHELESVGLSTQRDELEFAFLVRRTETINKCVEDLKEASQDHLACLRNSYDAE